MATCESNVDSQRKKPSNKKKNMSLKTVLAAKLLFPRWKKRSSRRLHHTLREHVVDKLNLSKTVVYRQRPEELAHRKQLLVVSHKVKVIHHAPNDAMELATSITYSSTKSERLIVCLLCQIPDQFISRFHTQLHDCKYPSNNDSLRWLLTTSALKLPRPNPNNSPAWTIKSASLVLPNQTEKSLEMAMAGLEPLIEICPRL